VGNWKEKIVTPEAALKKIDPGMHIFVGSAAAEPTTLVRTLMASDAGNLQDLELFQLISFGEAISLKTLQTQKFRLKTFYSGWVAKDSIEAGRVDLIPSRFSRLTRLIESERIPFDVAFVQITPPNDEGYASLGVSVDIAHLAISQASLVIGEINPDMPLTAGNSFVPINSFDYLVEADAYPMNFERRPPETIFDAIAKNVASVIDDGSCIAFSIDPLFESLGRYLQQKKDLSIHTPVFTDALMDLVKSGAVTNSRKEHFPNKSLTSYAMGSRELFKWIHQNPLIEFQGLDKVFNPIRIGRNPSFVSILPCRKIDLTGDVALHTSRGNITTDPAMVVDFFNGSEISEGGYSVFALPSRNLKDEPNIRISIESFPNQLNSRESVDLVVTEYGVANLNGRTIRERAQALIEIAHPDDRAELVEQAKEENILYKDQIFLAESAHLYPSDVETRQRFKDVTIRFRPIKPSDEEEMRRLFYRFSDEAVYYRYFTHKKSMPHSRMQAYVNIDYRDTMSVVAVVDEPSKGRIIGEARYVKYPDKPYGDVAFIVDEEYQGYGIATYMYKMLLRLAKERGLQGFTADVLPANKAMMRVFEKGDAEVKATLEDGIYHLTIPFR